MTRIFAVMDYQAILKQYWGYDSFRGIQEDIIRSIGEGRDTLGLMPTGGGKSVTFQVPALAQEGMCLVITPLIALMKDQVQNLKRRGIKALAVYSGMSRQDIIATLENAIFGNYKFLYISPERLDTEIFRIKLAKMKISLITVDESHCISQWGYDFRPAYLKIAEVRRLLPGVPVLALTATATPEVVKDIQLRLEFREENVFRMSFERTNLAYVVRRTENKAGELLHILQRMAGSAIIYVRNRRRTKEVTEWLQQQGITADFYHAGLDDAVKDIRQQRWQKGESRVMVATNAFGMASTSPTCGSSSTWTCPTPSKPTSRKRAVRDATDRRPTPSSCTPSRTARRCASVSRTLFRRKTISATFTSTCNTTTKWPWATDGAACASSTSRTSAASSSTSPSPWTAR